MYIGIRRILALEAYWGTEEEIRMWSCCFLCLFGFCQLQNFWCWLVNINLRYIFANIYFKYIQMHFHQPPKAEGCSSDWGHCQSVSGWILWPHFLTEQSKLCHRNVIEFEGFSALLRFWFFKIKISNLKRGTTLGDDNFTDIPKFCHITAKWGFRRP